MAINKKLIHFNTFENFNSKKLSANIENTKYTLGINGEIQNGSPDILYLSIVYIKDTKQQWTHGLLYTSNDNYFETKIESQNKLLESKDYTDTKTDELRDVVTQTLSLNTVGSMWCSFYVDITLEQLQQALGTNAASITTSYDGGETKIKSIYNADTNTWSGDLTTLDVTKMYQIYINTGCEISLTGKKIPNSIRYILNPGWNWIGYPSNNNSVDINIALNNLTPTSGDRIKDQNNGFAEFAFGKWMGALKQLVPGQGYMYNNKSGETKTLVFTAELIDTKSELNKKQDVITDLDAIRQGAAKGATALQNYTEQYKGTVLAVETSETLADVETNTYVKYVAQSLTDELKSQVKQNLGISENTDLSETYIYDISKSAINTGIGLINGIKLWTDPNSGESPTNFTFKTINGESILGNSDIVINNDVNWNDIQEKPNISKDNSGNPIIHTLVTNTEKFCLKDASGNELQIYPDKQLNEVIKLNGVSFLVTKDELTTAIENAITITLNTSV